MLPSFRVRGVRPVADPTITSARVASDGIIRMKKDDYDSLVRRAPETALLYLDEDDGEIVLVGSGFELDQRLKEPVGFDTSASTEDHISGDGPLHTFEVQRTSYAVNYWRHLDAETTKQRFVEQMNEPLAAARKRLSIIEGKKRMSATEDQLTDSTPLLAQNTNDIETYTPLKSTEKDVRFGQASPLSWNALARIPASSTASAHANRWSSYQALPSSFDQQPTALSTESAEPKVEVSNIEPPAPARTSSFHTRFPVEDFLNNLVPAAAVTKENLSTQAAPASGRVGTSQPDASKASPDLPLLSLFEQDLLRLAASRSKSFQTMSTESKGTSDSTTDRPQTATPSSKNTSKIEQSTPSEMFASSIESLVNSVCLMATGLSKASNGTAVELHLGDLRESIPRHVEQAFKNYLPNPESFPNLLPQFQEVKNRIDRQAKELENSLHKMASSYRPSPPLPTDPILSESAKAQATLDEISNALNTVSTASQQGANEMYIVDATPSTKPTTISKPTPTSTASATRTRPNAPWKVDRIIGKRFIQYHTTGGPCFTQYLVRWVGCGPADDMWYDEPNMFDCQELIQAFEAREGNIRNNIVPTEATLFKANKYTSAANLHVRTAGNSMVPWKEHTLVRNTEGNEASGSNESLAPAATMEATKSKVKFADEKSTNKINAHTTSSLLPRADSVGSRKGSRKTHSFTDTITSEVQLPFPPQHGSKDDSFAVSTSETLTQAAKKLKHRQSWHPVSSSSASIQASVSPWTSATATRDTKRHSAVPSVRTQWHNYFKNSQPQSERLVPDQSSLRPLTLSPDIVKSSGTLQMSELDSTNPWSASYGPTSSFNEKYNSMTPESVAGITGTGAAVDLSQPPQAVVEAVQIPPKRSRSILKKHASVDSMRKSEVPIESAETAASPLVESDYVLSMVEMGYTNSQAEMALTETRGDMNKAIDLLEEDRKVWEAERSNQARRGARGSQRGQDLLPGSWDEELYG